MLIATLIILCLVVIWGLFYSVIQVYNYFLQWKLEETYQQLEHEDLPHKQKLFIIKDE